MFARMMICGALLGLLGACGGQEDLSKPPQPMGEFLLGHNVVKATNAKAGPLSRKASSAEWEAAVSDAIKARLGRYQGNRLFHLGTHIDGYVLAKPGIPLVAAPQSVLMISVTVWDDAAQKKLTEKPKKFVVFERSEKPTLIVGSGLVNSKQEQMQNLSRNAARLIHNWLLDNKQWFEGAEATKTTARPAPRAKTGK